MILRPYNLVMSVPSQAQGEMQAVDCLIEARWVIPVEPEGVVLEDHSVAVQSGRIVAVLPSADARAKFSARQLVELPYHALIPGLINLHTHAAMTLMRGLADDLPLMQWLHGHIWPAEVQHVSAEFVHDGSLIACAEMLLGGVTTFNDMYFFPEATARAALESGMRAAIGIITTEIPTRYATDPEDYVQKGLATRDAFKGEDLLSFCMAPHAPYTVSDRAFERMLMLAEELDLPLHVHLHETQQEIADSLSAHGKRPIERLTALGLVGPRLIAVHGVHLSVTEADLLARSGASLAHCPSSNLKLASGFAPVVDLLARGVNVGLGTDGAASNNRLDLFQEMRLAALLAKASSGKAEAFPAAQALTAATLSGARALGMEDRLGSLLPGKLADLCAVRLDGPALSPCYDPVSHLVYAAGRENVTHVWVNGTLLVQEKRLISGKELDLDSRARLWQNKLVLKQKLK